MKRLMNTAESYIEDVLEGLCDFAPDLKRDVDSPRALYRNHSSGSKVGITTGGGGGHLPLFVGYVGEGLLDSCAVGNVFEGPTEEACIAAIQRANAGGGVLCIVGNYGGDRMNFAMACDELEDEVQTETVLVRDDIASGTLDNREARRGVAGLVLVYKVAGAAAASGASLAEVAEITRLAESRTRTIGAAFGPCQLPGATESAITLSPGEIEMGMGIHGEPGLWRQQLPDAASLASEMVSKLLEERPDDSGDDVAVLVNGLGATPLEDLLIFFRSVRKELDQRSINIGVQFVGPFVTSLDMPGVSLSLMWLNPAITEALNSPASSVFGGQQL